MSHFVAYILQFQEIIVYKIPPGGGEGSIASLRSTSILAKEISVTKPTKILEGISLPTISVHHIYGSFSQQTYL